MKLSLSILVLILFQASAEYPSFASIQSKTSQKHTFLLYDIKQGRSHRVTKLKPNRVYIVYSSTLKKWVFSMTDQTAHFPSPAEVLVPGTILPGSRLGGSGKVNYKLTRTGDWTPVKLLGFEAVWILGKTIKFEGRMLGETPL